MCSWTSHESYTTFSFKALYHELSNLNYWAKDLMRIGNIAAGDTVEGRHFVVLSKDSIFTVRDGIHTFCDASLSFLVRFGHVVVEL